jgi:hypothetical protein
LLTQLNIAKIDVNQSKHSNAIRLQTWTIDCIL